MKKLKPGDLLYIAKKSTSNPLQVSHGILWTGLKVQKTGRFSIKNLLKNVPVNQLPNVKEDIKKFKKAGLDIYIIADSHHAGPNYRIFAGWWSRAFTHARRIIGEKPKKSPSHMKFDGKVCKVSKK